MNKGELVKAIAADAGLTQKKQVWLWMLLLVQLLQI